MMLLGCIFMAIGGAIVCTKIYDISHTAGIILLGSLFFVVGVGLVVAASEKNK